MSEQIRVLLVEDHTIVREGLRALLDPCDDVNIVGEAGAGREALRMAAASRPDVVVTDLGLPDIPGVDVIEGIRGQVPDAQVVVLSMHAQGEYVRSAIRAGARGYLVKGAGLSDLVTAIRAVSKGEAFFSPSVAAVLIEPAESDDGLTGREREVLRLVAEGLSSSAISGKLGLSVKTVESHRGHIMRKLGVSNVAGLVRAAVRLRLVDADS